MLSSIGGGRAAGSGGGAGRRGRTAGPDGGAVNRIVSFDVTTAVRRSWGILQRHKPYWRRYAKAMFVLHL